MAAPGRTIDPHRLTLLQGLIRSLPAASLRALETALGLSKDAALAGVRDLIAVEMESRQVRDAVFQPFLPLFEVRQDGLEGVRFPRRFLSNIWNGLAAREADLFREAFATLRALRSEDPTPVVFFRLTKAGADLCRAEPEAVAGSAPEARSEAVELARYFDLHRIIRQTLSRMPEFMGRIDAEKAAALRVLFKDAAEFEDESGCRFLELIFANLEDGGQIIKFMATVADRPKDRFLAESELAVFGERILAHIEARVAALRQEMGTRTRPCEDMGLAAQHVAQALAQLQSFEHYVELARDGPWGRRVAAAHKEVAALVEQVMAGADKQLAQILPMRSERVHGRLKRETPDLDAEVAPARLEQALQVMNFIRQARVIAVSGGFSSLHAKTTQALEAYMDDWFGHLLSDANSGDLSDVDRAAEAFERVAGLMAALCGEDKARTARRRVAASELFKPRSGANGDAA